MQKTKSMRMDKKTNAPMTMSFATNESLRHRIGKQSSPEMANVIVQKGFNPSLLTTNG